MGNMLGFIRFQDRTNEQHDAHDAAVGQMVKFALPCPTLAKGQSVRLFDNWKHPDVVADVGLTFDRMFQWTGSCVRAGGTNALFSTIATQRLASDAPTKAFLPFTWHNYALSRHYMGADRPGEGSLGSTFARSLRDDGVRDWDVVASLPSYDQENGIRVKNSKVEIEWSTVRNPKVDEVLKVSKAHLCSATQARSVQDVKALILNGYGVSFACDRFIGHGEIKGSGDLARVMGHWDSRGGHQQSVHAVEEHEDFGPIYLVLNNWDKRTYPTLPSQPVCSTWVTEDYLAQALRYGAEVYGYSRQDWFPANPKVLLDWSNM